MHMERASATKRSHTQQTNLNAANNVVPGVGDEQYERPSVGGIIEQSNAKRAAEQCRVCRTIQLPCGRDTNTPTEDESTMKGTIITAISSANGNESIKMSTN